MKHVLLAGVSTRAAAESAARAGFVVTAIDAFGDLDQHASVRSFSLRRDFGVRFTAQAAARGAQSIECDAVAYLASFENHPGAVGALAWGRSLWGNTPAVLRRVRDPVLLAATLRRRGFATPDACGRADASGSVTASETYVASGFSRTHRHWLIKPLASGGGHGVRAWHGEKGCVSARSRLARPPRGCYLQEHVDGTPGSVTFVAAGGRAVPLGVSRQLVGEEAFGAEAYRYCGNILAAAGDAHFARDEALVDAACALVRAVAEEYAVVGVNGIDFIARDASPYAIEVNPRWCGSMELVERAYGLSLFAAHAAACSEGTLPEFDLLRARCHVGAVGKAVVFARREVVVGDTRAWLPEGDLGAASIRDVPHPGERILAGRPVCTVFATGRDGAACHAALVQRAQDIYANLAAWEQMDNCRIAGL